MTPKQATIVRPTRIPTTQAPSVEEELQKTFSEVEEKIDQEQASVKEKPSEPNKEDVNEKELTPIERWRKRLETVGITEAEAEAIADTILRQGYWEQEFSLLPTGKLKMKLRTRDSIHRQRLANALSNTANTQAAQYETIARFELASSLVKFGDEVFTHPDASASGKELDDAFVQRLDFVDKRIPDPLQDPVRLALSKFNARVFAALTEGSVEGF